MTSIDEIKETVRAYIIREFLPEEDPAELTDSVPLITGGILDSLVTLKLVTFLEETYGIRFEAYEVTVDNLDTIAEIARFVSSKL
jgi:acyl carrier protein